MKLLSRIFSDRAWAFIALGALTLILRFIFSFFPNAVELIYSRGLFLAIRWGLDQTLGRFPFPFSYALAVIIVSGLVFRFIRRRKLGKRDLKTRFKQFGKGILGLVGIVVFLFNFLWGFNYSRVPIETHLGMQLDSLSLEQLCLEADWIARRAEEARKMIPNATEDSLDFEANLSELEIEVRESIYKCMKRMDYPAVGRIRGRMINPGGWMLRIGIAGIYNPFTGEGNVSQAQTMEKWPYTMAHEMAHACGFGDEGTCNFIGMIACEQSENPYLLYSGRMGYWRQLVSEIFAADPEMYLMLRNNLDAGIQADLKASYNNAIKYAGGISKFGRGVNNAFLRAQGVKEGIKSYDRVVLMRAAWHSKTGQ